MGSSVKFTNNFPLFYKKLDNAIVKANVISAREIVNGAKRITRVDSGMLRDSYVTNARENNGKRITFSNTQSYFAYQEQGTKYIKPTKALETTINYTKEHIAKNYASQITKEMNNLK